MRNLNTSAICTETSENVTERPFLDQHGSNTRASVAYFWPSIYKTDVCYGVYGLVFRSPCATSNASAICTETSENVTEHPFLDQHGSNARASVAHFWPSIYKTIVCYGVYGLVFRSPCATSNTSAICIETSENVTERPFLDQHGSNARASVANFWPSIYKTNVCYGVYGLVFRSPCTTSIQVLFALKPAKMRLNDRFSISTAPTRENQWRIFDRLYIRQLFAMGCTG
jgi:hypothetical protein